MSQLRPAELRRTEVYISTSSNSLNMELIVLFSTVFTFIAWGQELSSFLQEWFRKIRCSLKLPVNKIVLKKSIEIWLSLFHSIISSCNPASFRHPFTQSQVSYHISTVPKEESQKILIFVESLDLPHDFLPVIKIYFFYILHHLFFLLPPFSFVCILLNSELNFVLFRLDQNKFHYQENHLIRNIHA